jgi:hypothetical protein
MVLGCPADIAIPLMLLRDMLAAATASAFISPQIE